MKTTSSISIRTITLPQILVGLFGVVVASILFFALTPQMAFANTGECPSPSDPMCSSVGGQDPGTDTGTKPKPPTQTGSYKYDFSRPANEASFSLICSNWSGSKSWKISARCNTTEAAIKAANPLSPKVGQSFGTGYGGKTFGLKATGCGNGTVSPFKQNWRVRNTADYTQTVYIYSDGSRTYSDITWMGTNVAYSFQSCTAPTAQKQYTRCYWNNQGSAAYSINRKAALSSWKTYYVRPVSASDPKAPTGGTGNSAPSGKCSNGSSISHFVYTGANVDQYGYYTVASSFNHRLYTHTKYVGGGRTWYNPGWTAGSTASSSSRTFYTYSCVTNGNALKGPYNSQNALPNVDAYTNPATCPQVSWQCELDTPTTIGLDRTAVLNGTVNPNSTSTVMRNGEKINVDFARVRVVDTSTSQDIDITNGGSAPGVRNITDISYNTKVAPNSTPFYGDKSKPTAANTNSANQYFKYYADRSSTKKTEKFFTWLPNNNGNMNKAVSFNWAGDSGAAFKLTRSYRVSGEFLVPGGSSISTSGATNTGYIWKPGSYDCMEYSGRGSTRVSLGPLVSTSNPVEVVRAVNQ